jgi:hypothetical protein
MSWSTTTAGEPGLKTRRKLRTPTQRRHHVQYLARTVVPLGPPAGPGRGHKAAKRRSQGGHRQKYLVARIARDRPDVLARMKAGEFTSVRQAAIAAGIVKLATREEA